MNIIICGAGRVGFSISKQLSAQGHSITVVDQSSDFIQKINTLYQRPVKDIDFFPQTIREDDMTPEDKRIEAAVLYGTKNITKPRPGVKRDRTIRKLRKKKKGSNTSRAMKNTIKELTDILEGKTTDTMQCNFTALR